MFQAEVAQHAAFFSFGLSLTLKVEAACFSETSVPLRSTQHHISEVTAGEPQVQKM
jgi:hypothetical protein